METRTRRGLRANKGMPRKCQRIPGMDFAIFSKLCVILLTVYSETLLRNFLPEHELKIDVMSHSTTQVLACPCGQEFSYQSYEHVNVAAEPQLRYVVLAGLLNVAICPFCGRRAEMSMPFLYSDPAY